MKLRAATTTDGYKVGHGPLYATGTQSVNSNLTPRSDKIYLRNCTHFYDGKLVFIGAQGAVQEVHEMWQDSFFNLPKEVAIGRFARRMAVYLGGKVKAEEQLSELHDLGYLPLNIKALPEGVRVKMGIPVLTITNTISSAFWLVNYLETVLSDLIWKPATNATIAYEYKEICKHFAAKTGVDDFTVSIQCHDFSMRGMSGPEDAARSGFAHLTSFIGTDTLPAMDYAEDYYDADPDGLIAISVVATEHAVATSNILYLEQERVSRFSPNPRLEAETEFMRDLITRLHPNGIVSYVADSFDFWSVLTEILPQLKDTILARESKGLEPGKLVIRPDSGDPADVICGIEVRTVKSIDAAAEELVEQVRTETGFGECGPSEASDIFFINGEHVEVTIGIDWNRHDKTYYYEDGHEIISHKVVTLTAEEKGAIQVLWETFGGTETEKGYKLLDSHIGLIYGDSITTKRAVDILQRLANKGFASGNVVFGVGSYTYQCNTRDTFGFVVKATHTVVDSTAIDIFKDPKTDSKKKSAKGLLFVGYNSDGGYVLEDQATVEEEASPDNKLQTFYLDGKFTRRTTLDEIRARLA